MKKHIHTLHHTRADKHTHTQASCFLYQFPTPLFPTIPLVLSTLSFIFSVQTHLNTTCRSFYKKSLYLTSHAKISQPLPFMCVSLVHLLRNCWYFSHLTELIEGDKWLVGNFRGWHVSSSITERHALSYSRAETTNRDDNTFDLSEKNIKCLLSSWLTSATTKGGRFLRRRRI